MTLTPGTRLGPFEIVSALGAGGMGEVYKARDTRLDRTVALKVSKEEFSDRFGREARAVAALNHPNICTLHDVGPNYLVMELVEGTPLAGPLPVETCANSGRSPSARSSTPTGTTYVQRMRESLAKNVTVAGAPHVRDDRLRLSGEHDAPGHRGDQDDLHDEMSAISPTTGDR
jgi:serine/threonine protein kinase